MGDSGEVLTKLANGDLGWTPCNQCVAESDGESVSAKSVDWFDVLKKILTEVDWETLLKFIRETAAVFQDGEDASANIRVSPAEVTAKATEASVQGYRVMRLGLLEMYKLYRTITKYVSPEDLGKLVEVVKGLLGALQSTKSFASRAEDFRVNHTELGSLYEELGYTKLASDIEALGINFDLATLITLLTTLLEVLQYFKGK